MLLNQSCSPCVNLIENTFPRLPLKDEHFQVYPPASQAEMESLFKSTVLDEELCPVGNMSHLPKRPHLEQYLSHCCRERNYCFSIIKCGDPNCKMCKPTKLHLNDFQHLRYLPDAMPSDDDVVHYESFQDVFGTGTDESVMSSLKTGKCRSHGIQFNPVKQHANNTSFFLVCAECNKPRLIYAAKKMSEGENKNFKDIMSDMLYTCGAQLAEFTNPNETAHRKARYADLAKVFSRANLTCLSAVEPLYYSLNRNDCCCRCGCKERLIKSANDYPICIVCKEVRKKYPVAKRKRKALSADNL